MKGRGAREKAMLFACPVCLQINSYTAKNLHRVGFRRSDPYRAGKLALYSARAGCAEPGCRREHTVFAVAAAGVSIASMLRLWNSWKANVRCGGHRWRMRNSKSWWVQQEQSLAGNAG
jgi:hypothetical protein